MATNNGNAKRFYENGADPDTRRVLDSHINKVNEYIDQVTNTQRRDYVQTNAQNAAAVFSQMKNEAYKSIENYRQKRLAGKENAIKSERQEVSANSRPNEYHRRKYGLKYKLAKDEQLYEKLEYIRDTDKATALAVAFENSSDLESFINEVDRRENVKKAVMPVVSSAFERTGADPTDVDSAKLLQKLDEKKQIQAEEPGTVKVQIYDHETGEPKHKVPVKFDSLVDKVKLEKVFQVKL